MYNFCTVLTPLFHPVMQDHWSHSLLALFLCLGQSCSQTPGLAVTVLFEESRRLSFPGFPLSNLNAALAFESRKLCAAQAQSGWCCRAWWCLVRGAEPPAAPSCLLQPPSVRANCQLCSLRPTRSFRARSVLLGQEHWKGLSGLLIPLCCTCKCL